MNLFGTVLTYTAPSANYRGEGAENRAVIQKITKGRFEYAIISPEAIRNALRESLVRLGLPANRKRLHDEEQLAVCFSDYPDPDRFADDFFMGWLVAAKKGDKDDGRKAILKELKDKGRNPAAFTFKRDSILRMNMALALEKYRYDTVFTQSPQDRTPEEVKKHRNVENAQLLHRETTHTAFQYPFALNLEECRDKPDWTKALLSAIGQLNDTAGNHARSYYEMAPASVLVRLTERLAAGYDTYGFRVNDDGKHELPEIVAGILEGDYPGKEFHLGGRIVKDMEEKTKAELERKGTVLDRNPLRLLESLGQAIFPA